MIDTTEAAYRLTYQPDGTSITVRENLVDILARELLGHYEAVRGRRTTQAA